MTARQGLAAAVAAVIWSFSYPAQAHVDYVELTPGGAGGAAFSNYGWQLGITPTLGDSHALAGGVFFKFHLDDATLVSLTFSDSSNTGALNPAFSLYRGLLPDEAHDDTIVDPLNPKSGPPSFEKIPSPVDNGVTADAFGRVSPFRDTEHVTFVGQFDALHSWSMANASGDWSVIEYLTHVAPTGGTSVSLTNYYLAAGDYTVAAAGGSVCDISTCLTNLDGTLHLTVTPVPEPGAIWLLAAGLGLLAIQARRRWAN